MDGLSFITATPPVGSDPARADIACFVGFVARRPVAPREADEADEDFIQRLPASLREWLREHDWEPGRNGRTAEDLVDLNNVPVPIDTWDVFDALFSWDARLLDSSGRRCDGLLGAAVRNFFAQGGRKCYVVRLGDAPPVLADTPERRLNAAAIFPSFPPPVAVDRGTWRGIGHLFGLPDVSFLCVPDLPDLLAVTPNPRPVPSLPTLPEEFKECAEGAEPPATVALRGIPAPRCDEEGFHDWSILVRRIGEFLRSSAREVQFVAAIPLPVDKATLAGQPDAANRARAASEAQWAQAALIQTAFVQLAYPWVRTRDSAALPGGVEPPDGVLAGLLANSALSRGSWRSALRQPVPGVSAVEPVLDRATLQRVLPLTGTLRLPLTVRERVTVIGPSPGGFRILSDVTTDDDEAYRPANVNRLVGAIVRAARVTGETAVFQNNGEALWRRLRESMEGLLVGLWADGALAGEFAAEAFEVRCDRSTITQSDLDAGRVICRISFTAASPIVHVTVVLAMDEGGNVSLASRQPIAAPKSQAA
jgi:hypothetical protein